MNAEKRDAYLQSALRHAPDAALGPAPALSEAILQEARAKARVGAPAAPPKRSSAWLGLWNALARPSIATGFAGVMVAVILGMMWWDRPLDEALPHRPDHAPAMVATAPAAPPAMEPAPAQGSSAAARPEPAAQAKRQADTRTSSAGMESSGPVLRKPTVREREDVAKDALREKARPAAPPAPALAADQVPAVDAAAQSVPPAALAQVPPLARAPSEKAAEQLAAGAALPASDDRPKSKRVANAAMASSAMAFAPEATLRDHAARAGAATGVIAAGSPGDLAPLSAVRALLGAEPSQWAWQRADGAAHSMDPPVLLWLSRLDATIRNGWQPRNGEVAAPRGRELRLLREGRVVHSLRLAGNAVLWDREGAAPLQAFLPPATLGALQASLDAAAP